MARTMHKIWPGEDGQDIAEYAIMFALILVLVIGTVRLVGGNVHHAFTSVAHVLQPGEE